VIVANLFPYPEYQKSSVPWLDRVPKHWQTRQLRTLASEPIRNGVGESAQPFRLDWPRYIRITDIAGPRALRSNTRASLPVETAARARVKEGDLLLAAVGATYGKSYLHRDAGTPACFAGYLVRLSPNADVRPEFLSYWTESAAYWDQVNSQVIQSTIQNFSAGRYKGLRVSLPPLPEQAAIVRFLDHADRRIRRYIAAKKRLVALLNEQKQAIIHRAVTRGLDPTVRLRPAGVEWLGDVPEHWVVSRVKNEFKCLNSIRVPLSATERGAMTARAYDYYGASSVIDRVDNFLFDDELLLLAEDGANLVLRNLPLVVIARGKFWVNNHAHILKPRRGNLEFLAYLLESYRYDPWISGAAQPKLTKDRLMSVAMAVPKRAEQDRIVDWIAAEIEPLSTGISQARHEAELLREWRVRLVADVVTGKLDVREAAAQLTDEVEEPEPPEGVGSLAEHDESEDEGDLGGTAVEVEA
jgi:type I restriction enzyme, S subunit